MSKSIIGFGKCSKYYFFILGTVICKTLNTFMFRNELDPKNSEGIFHSELYEHNYIQFLYKYISFIIGGILMECILKKSKQIKEIILILLIN